MTNRLVTLAAIPVAALAASVALAGPAAAIQEKGAPKYVSVVNQSSHTIKVSGHKIRPGHTASHYRSSSLTVRSNSRFDIVTFGAGLKGKCRKANVTYNIRVTKTNSGSAHQFAVKDDGC